MSQPAATANTNEKITGNESVQNASNALSPGFNTNLFGCFEDIVGCLMVCCLECVPLAANRANVDAREAQWADFFCCPNPYQTRQSMRIKYGMEFAPFNDCGAALCCTCCFIHQNTREIASRTGNNAEYIKLPQ